MRKRTLEPHWRLQDCAIESEDVLSVVPGGSDTMLLVQRELNADLEWQETCTDAGPLPPQTSGAEDMMD